MSVPEINPRMSGDPSALVEKLRIDAPGRHVRRMLEDSKALNRDVTLPSYACRLNVKYHERYLGFGSSLAAGLAVGGRLGGVGAVFPELAAADSIIRPDFADITIICKGKGCWDAMLVQKIPRILVCEYWYLLAFEALLSELFPSNRLVYFSLASRMPVPLEVSRMKFAQEILEEDWIER